MAGNLLVRVSTDIRISPRAEAAHDSVYSIGAVAKMIGASPSTLRAWEQRYAVITPSRSFGSQRLYSSAQVEQLRFIKASLESGASAADAHRLLAQDLAAASSSRTPLPDAADPQPAVLVIERDNYAAAMEKHWLAQGGFRVILEPDPQKARSAFVEQEPDLVIVDLLLSGGRGYQLVRDLSAIGTAWILAVSPIDDAEQASGAGASGFLRKPFDYDTLLSTVRDLVRASSGPTNPEHRTQWALDGIGHRASPHALRSEAVHLAESQIRRASWITDPS